MAVLITAWGNRHGPAPPSDHEFTLTGLRNPHRVKGLWYLTGHDPVVQRDVWASPHAEERYQRILRKVKESAASGDVSVVFVCTGGRHRSVTFTLRLYADLRAVGIEALYDTPFAKEET